ncbi:MAG: hypothetical protein ACXABO_14170 [Promethearchaeota archaeon]|jgi:hypothetical protein
MKFILKIRPNRKKKIIAWIEKNKYFNDNTQQLFKFFKEDIHISKWSKIMNYYVVSSENPGVILSLFSAIQESIPEIYFNSQDSRDAE